MKENAKMKTKTPLDQDIIHYRYQLWTGNIWEGLIQYRRSIKFSNYKNNFQQKIDEDFAEESAK